jgi:hypothetical protein
MKKRQWKKRGERVYRYETTKLQSLIFSAPNFYMWAWAVWAEKESCEGVEYGLRAARLKANAAIDRIEAAP